MLTHRNLAAASAQDFESTGGTPRILAEGEERFLVVLPLFHIYALSAVMLLGLRLGATLVLHTKFDVDAGFKEIAEGRISAFSGTASRAETFFIRWLRACRADSARASFLLSVRVTRCRRAASASLRDGVGRSFLAGPASCCSDV